MSEKQVTDEHHEFHRFKPGEDRRAKGATWLVGRPIPKTIGSHWEGAKYYQADEPLTAAINTALSVGAPLLLTGEPGTGKTQVAYHLAHYFGLDDALFALDVRSTTTAKDMLYQYDAVAYFHAAHDPRRREQDLHRRDFVKRGPLWQAYEVNGPSVVLIDEVDKAPRDFPNDLLNVIEQHTFEVPEADRTGNNAVKLADGQQPPIVVITSNNERQLPAAFLRRCIFHHIELTQELVKRAVRARGADFPRLPQKVREMALRKFFELRKSPIRKKPAIAELLVWLTVLDAKGVTTEELNRPLTLLPAKEALVKDREDEKRLK